jgi:uncharacterized protein
MFICDGCGLCCKNLPMEAVEFHDGDGICKYLHNNRCLIYHRRPLVCNVQLGYEVLFRDTMTEAEFYELNYRACKKLKSLNSA